jgi:hypothetical protein
VFTIPANKPKFPFVPPATRLKVPPKAPKDGGLIPALVHTENLFPAFIAAVVPPIRTF